MKNTLYHGCHYKTGESSVSVDFFPVPLLDVSFRTALKRELVAEDRPDVIVMSTGVWFLRRDYIGTNDSRKIVRMYKERVQLLKEVT